MNLFKCTLQTGIKVGSSIYREVYVVEDTIENCLVVCKKAWPNDPVVSIDQVNTVTAQVVGSRKS